MPKCYCISNPQVLSLPTGDKQAPPAKKMVMSRVSPDALTHVYHVRWLRLGHLNVAAAENQEKMTTDEFAIGRIWRFLLDVSPGRSR
jgi:hypothetical protein